MFFSPTIISANIRHVKGCVYVNINNLFTQRQTHLDMSYENYVMGVQQLALAYISVIDSLYATDDQKSQAYSALQQLSYGNCNLSLSQGSVTNGYYRGY